MTNLRTVRVAQDLAAVLDLVAASRVRRTGHSRPTLLAQAVALADARVDRSPLPGGAAMVALGPVADLATWAARVDAGERTGDVRTAIDLEDPEDQWPPLQVLRAWSDAWRELAHQPTAHATLASEATWLRRHLDDAHDRLTDAEWTAFTRDVGDVRRRLEDLLADGERVERGVPCMDPGCRGRRLIRKLQLARDDHGREIWRHSDWHCPSCKRRYGPVEYRTMVATAHAATQRESYLVRRDVLVTGTGLTMVVEDDITWCSVAYAAGVVRRPEATIRSWVHRDQVATVCLVAGRRTGFVSLDDVLARASGAPRTRRSAAGA